MGHTRCPPSDHEQRLFPATPLGYPPAEVPSVRQIASCAGSLQPRAPGDPAAAARTRQFGLPGGPHCSGQQSLPSASSHHAPQALLPFASRFLQVFCPVPHFTSPLNLRPPRTSMGFELCNSGVCHAAQADFPTALSVLAGDLSHLDFSGQLHLQNTFRTKAFPTLSSHCQFPAPSPPGSMP